MALGVFGGGYLGIAATPIPENPPVSDCPFCLSNNLLEGKVLGRDQFCYITPTDDPVLQSSVLIVPFRHVATPFEFTTAEWNSTRDLLAQARQLLDAERPDGYSIGWNVHPVGGQSIPHAHLHVIGRFTDEPMAGQGIRHALKQWTNRRPS